MNLYLAGTMSRPYVFGGGGYDMNIYLVGEHPVKNGKLSNGNGQYILESYYYCRNNDWIPKLLPKLGGFLLDSGAYTFMYGKDRVDWNKYTEEYAKWINEHDINLFFELDIDSIVGLCEVERLRKKLEYLTKKKPIPVWHISRGKEYFIKMCCEYPYVALGGIVGAKKGSTAYKQYQSTFPWFINTAHKAGAKIHGLGYTSLEGIKKYHFDSVDSTAWLFGNRGGYLYKFNPQKGSFDKIQTPPGYRLASQDAARWNFNEWVKFQNYARKYL